MILSYTRALICVCAAMLSAHATASAPPSFANYVDCGNPPSVTYPPGGTASFADQNKSNFHNDQPERDGAPSEAVCVQVSEIQLVATEPVTGFNPFQVNQLAQVNSNNPGNPPTNPGTSDDTVFGDYSTQCQPDPANPHVAIDNLQGTFTVNVSQQGGFFTVSAPLPFGTYQVLFSGDPLDGPPVGIGGSFTTGGVPNAPARTQDYSQKNLTPDWTKRQPAPVAAAGRAA